MPDEKYQYAYTIFNFSLYFYNKYKTDFLKISRKIKKTANVWTVNVSPTTVVE